MVYLPPLSHPRVTWGGWTSGLLGARPHDGRRQPHARLVLRRRRHLRAGAGGRRRGRGRRGRGGLGRRGRRPVLPGRAGREPRRGDRPRRPGGRRRPGPDGRGPVRRHGPPRGRPAGRSPPAPSSSTTRAACATPSSRTSSPPVGAALVITHSLAPPRTHLRRPRYDDVVDEVKAFLADRVQVARDHGVRRGPDRPRPRARPEQEHPAQPRADPAAARDRRPGLPAAGGGVATRTSSGSRPAWPSPTASCPRWPPPRPACSAGPGCCACTTSPPRWPPPGCSRPSSACASRPVSGTTWSDAEPGRRLSEPLTTVAVVEVWSRAQVLAAAPDDASRRAALPLTASRIWSESGRGPTGLLWGRCRGSATYAVVVEPGQSYACSCPSRKSPCKHALALLLRWTDGLVGPGDPPAWAPAAGPARGRSADEERVPGRRRRGRPGRRAAGQGGRRARRAGPLAADQVRTGLSAWERRAWTHVEGVAARMVDAQAPGVAGLLRGLPGLLARDAWPEHLLDALAGLHLLVVAHRGLDRLPDDLAATVRSRVGYPVAKATVLARPMVVDHWWAVGAVDSLDGRLETRRVWLWGSTTRSWAMLLSFAVPGAGLDESVAVGQLLNAAVHRYPGGGEHRVLLGEQWPVEEGAAPRPDRAGPPSRSPQPSAAGPPRSAADPWASRMPAVLRAVPVPPTRPGEPWHLADPDGSAVRLVAAAARAVAAARPPRAAHRSTCSGSGDRAASPPSGCSSPARRGRRTAPAGGRVSTTAPPGDATSTSTWSTRPCSGTDRRAVPAPTGPDPAGWLLEAAGRRRAATLVAGASTVVRARCARPAGGHARAAVGGRPGDPRRGAAPGLGRRPRPVAARGARRRRRAGPGALGPGPRPRPPRHRRSTAVGWGRPWARAACGSPGTTRPGRRWSGRRRPRPSTTRSPTVARPRGRGGARGRRADRRAAPRPRAAGRRPAAAGGVRRTLVERDAAAPDAAARRRPRRRRGGPVGALGPGAAPSTPPGCRPSGGPSRPSPPVRSVRDRGRHPGRHPARDPGAGGRAGGAPPARGGRVRRRARRAGGVRRRGGPAPPAAAGASRRGRS